MSSVLIPKGWFISSAGEQSGGGGGGGGRGVTGLPQTAMKLDRRGQAAIETSEYNE